MFAKYYKYCIVPMCTNTTIKTPEKIFIHVPRRIDIRRRWCLAMRRDVRKNPVLSELSTRYVCEDHFDLENDTENYIRYKLQGVYLRLKKRILPHRFACQKRDAPTPATSAKRTAKKRRKKVLPKDSNFSDSSSSAGPSRFSTTDEIKMEGLEHFSETEQSRVLSASGHSKFLSPYDESMDDFPDASGEPISFLTKESITCTVSDKNIEYQCLGIDIKQEPEETVTLHYQVENIDENESKNLNQEPGSLLQPPVLIKQEIVSSEDEL